MDKTLRNWKVQSIIAITTLVVILSQATAVSAGTVVASPPPPPQAPGPGEEFPESRFGMPPIRVNTGVSETYAAEETHELDAEERAAGFPSYQRKPAGMVFGAGQQQDAVGNTSARANVSKTGAVYPDHEQVSNQVRATRSSQGGGGRGARSAASIDTGSQHPPLQVPSPEFEAAAIRRKGVQEVALIASDLGYFPKTIFVTRDIPVRLFVTGSSKNTLCIMMDSFAVRKQVRSQKIEEITFTPNLPGQYRYYCPVNGMEGVLIVKELTTNLAAH